MDKQIPLEDHETRRRLLKAAARLFAERGFNHVSVREICKEAGTNVAAVNYHFRDKLSLYSEVIDNAADQMNRCKIAAMDSGAAQSTEEQLRAYIRSFLHQLLDANPEEGGWIDKIIARELAEPTSALDLIIEKGIKPAADNLAGLVSKLLGLQANDPRALLAASSIQGLCLWYRSSRTVAERMVPVLRFTPDVVDGIARFVADFALAGLRGVAQQEAGYGQALSALVTD